MAGARALWIIRQGPADLSASGAGAARPRRPSPSPTPWLTGTSPLLPVDRPSRSAHFPGERRPPADRDAETDGGGRSR